MVTESSSLPSRWNALVEIADAYPTDPLVVTLGGTTRELAALKRSPNHLYVLDSMGLPPAIGLGLALGLKDSSFEKVVVLEGDGSLLMGFSTLATIGLTKPNNLVLLILDNGTYAATGNQPTAAAVVDFCQVARACGIEAREVGTIAELKEGLAWTRKAAGPVLLRIRIDNSSVRVPFLLEDPVLVGKVFADYITAKK